MKVEADIIYGGPDLVVEKSKDGTSKVLIDSPKPDSPFLCLANERCLTENFFRHEFACPCCGKADMDPLTIYRLQELRTLYGKSIGIVEGGGFRCEAYDGKQGAHTEGRAVDPAMPLENLYRVIGRAYRVGFLGIGVKQKGGRWQLHLDDVPPKEGRPRP